MPGRRQRKHEESAVDLTPMIDVVFQLIIFFVVTVNLDQQSVLEEIDLPDAKYSREEKRKDPRQVTIQVDKKGNYYIGASKLTLRELNGVLRNTVRTAGVGNVPVLIRGDVGAAHKNVRRVMDICAAAGLYKIKFAGLKQEAEEPKVP